MILSGPAPGEGFGIMLGLCDDAVDGGLKIDHGWKTPSFSHCLEFC